MIENINDLSLDELIAKREEAFKDTQILAKAIQNRRIDEEESKYSHLINKIITDGEGGFMLVKRLESSSYSVNFIGPSLIIRVDETGFDYTPEDSFLVYEDPIKEVSFEEFTKILNEAIFSIKNSFTK